MCDLVECVVLWFDVDVALCLLSLCCRERRRLENYQKRKTQVDVERSSMTRRGCACAQWSYGDEVEEKGHVMLAHHLVQWT